MFSWLHARPRPLSITPVLLALLVAGLPRHARGQEAPQPSPEIKRLTALAGKFEGEAQYTAGGKTIKFTLHHENRVGAGGFCLVNHEMADVPGMGHYEAENLFGWDAGKGELHLYSVTNDPYTHDHAGRFTDEKHATLRYEGLRSGKKLTEVIPMEILGSDEYRFKSTLTVAGGSPEVFVATMRRVSELSAR